MIAAIRENDEHQVEEAVLQLAGTRRIFAPLAMAVGAFVMLFSGFRLLVTNWRLMLVQVLPAFWLWAVTVDLKVHVLRGKVSAKLLAGRAPQPPGGRAPPGLDGVEHSSAPGSRSG